MNRRVLGTFFGLLLVSPPSLFAKGHRPPFNGPIAAGERVLLQTRAAGLEGFYAIWNSSSPTGIDLVGQYFSIDGTPQWGAPNGRTLVESIRHPGAWDSCEDDKGGFLIASVDRGRLKVRRFNKDGRPTWEAPLSQMTDDPVASVAMISDHTGGAFVAWEQEGTAATSIFVQRWDATGKPQWVLPGVQPAISEARQTNPVLSADGEGGVMVGWKSYLGDNSRARLQRLSGGGERLWRDNGVVVQSPAGDLRQRLLMTAPGHGGAVVVWTDGVSGKNRVFYQHVQPDGARDWSAGGVTTGVTQEEQWNPTLMPGAQDNLWVTWERVADGMDQRISLVRRDPPKGAMWPAGEVSLAKTPGSQGRLAMALAPDGSVVAAWIDNRTSTGLYLQHIDNDGRLLLADGKAIDVNLHRPQQPHIVVMPGLRVGVVWLDDLPDKRWAIHTAVTSYSGL